MTAAEEAWKWCERKGWHPHAADTEDPRLNEVRAVLRQLQSMRLPIAAIEQVEQLLVKHHAYIEYDDRGRRRVGQVPTQCTSVMIAHAREDGHEIDTTLVSDNHRHSFVYVRTKAAEHWFKGWRAAKMSG